MSQVNNSFLDQLLSIMFVLNTESLIENPRQLFILINCSNNPMCLIYNESPKNHFTVINVAFAESEARKTFDTALSAVCVFL